jgi:hypothetical protein
VRWIFRSCTLHAPNTCALMHIGMTPAECAAWIREPSGERPFPLVFSRAAGAAPLVGSRSLSSASTHAGAIRDPLDRPPALNTAPGTELSGTDTAVAPHSRNSRRHRHLPSGALPVVRRQRDWLATRSPRIDSCLVSLFPSGGRNVGAERRTGFDVQLS